MAGVAGLAGFQPSLRVLRNRFLTSRVSVLATCFDGIGTTNKGLFPFVWRVLRREAGNVQGTQQACDLIGRLAIV